MLFFVPLGGGACQFTGQNVQSVHAYDQGMTVVIATCADLPTGDEDGDALIAALAERATPARWQVWNDPNASWSDDLVVVRSTWDYTGDREGFLSWARSVPRLVNPAEVIAWNSDKSYLTDLADAGLPVVPSAFVAVGESAVFPTGEDFVLKPSVGAGSMGAGRFGADAHAPARAHVTALHDAGRTVLIQPYLGDVDTAGETALVYLDGEFSHAVGKGAMLSPQVRNPLDAVSGETLFAVEHITRREPSVAELDVGARAMQVLRERLGADLLYARVDLLPTSDGPVLIELELVEPSLFLGYDDEAVHRLAAAIAVRA